jgi:HEAT repeat protein
LNEKAIAGLLGALGVVVVLAAALVTVWSLLMTEQPVPGPVIVESDDAAETAPGPETVEAAPGFPDRPGPSAGRDPDDRIPVDDDTGAFDVTYEKLRAALEKRDFAEIKRLVAIARGQVDPKFVADLVALLEDKAFGFNAGTVLGQIKTPGTVETLFRFLLETESEAARRSAVQAMARSGGSDAVPRLLDLMNRGGELQLVALTATALGSIGTPEAVRGLLDLLSSRRFPNLDGSLQGALAQVRDEAGVAMIAAALEGSNDEDTKRSLIQALGRGQSPAAVEPLRKLVAGAEPVELRAQGVSALGAVGNADAIRTVLALAKGEGPLRNVAQYALQSARDPAVLKELVQSLETTDDPQLERSLLVAMGSVGDRSVTPRIVEKLETSPSVDTRIAAVQALGKMREDPGAVEALGKTLRGDGHVNLRVQAARALMQLGDPKNIPVLKSALEDEDIPANLKAVVNYSIRRLEMKIPPKPRETGDGAGSRR